MHIPKTASIAGAVGAVACSLGMLRRDACIADVLLHVHGIWEGGITWCDDPNDGNQSATLSCIAVGTGRNSGLRTDRLEQLRPETQLFSVRPMHHDAFAYR